MAAGLVALGSVLTVLVVPLLRVAHAFDGSPAGPVLVAGLPTLLPAAVALGLSWWRPAAGLWATAVAGGFGLVRLGADLDLLAGPDAVVRPELFHETTLRAHPFGLSAGSALLVVGDLITVAGAVAAGRLIAGRPPGSVGSLQAGAAPRRVPVAGPGAPATRPGIGTHPGLGSDPRGGDPTARSRLRWPVLTLGLVGVVLAVIGALVPPYAGGYLVNRLLPPDTGVWSLVAVLPLGLLTGGAVLIAARTTGAAARAGLATAGLATAGLAAAGLAAAGLAAAGLAAAGLAVAALAVAAPALVALLVVADGVDLSLTGSWVITLAAAVALAGAALAAATSRPIRPAPGPSRPKTAEAREAPKARGAAESPESQEAAEAPPRFAGPVRASGAAILGLLAAGAATVAATGSGLLVDGHPDGPADSGLASGYPWSAPIGLPFALTAGFLVLAAVLAAIRPVAPAGRVLLGLSVAVSGYAATQGLLVYQQVASLVPGSVSTTLFTVHRWSIGPGLWWGIAGLALALLAGIAAIGAGSAQRRDRDMVDAETELARWRAGPDQNRADQDRAEPDRADRDRADRDRADRDRADRDRDDRAGGAVDPRRLLTGVLLLLILVAAFLPVYSTSDGPGPAASFYAVGSVGVWLLTAGAVAGVLTAGLARTPGAGWAGAVGAAALVAIRWPVPASVAALPGYRTETGWVLIAVVAVLVVVGSALLAELARRADRSATGPEPGGPAAVVARSGAAPDPRSVGVSGSSRRDGRPGPTGSARRPGPSGSTGRKCR